MPPATKLRPLDEDHVGVSLLPDGSESRGYASQPTTPKGHPDPVESARTKAECVMILLLCGLALAGFGWLYLMGGMRALGSR